LIACTLLPAAAIANKIHPEYNITLPRLKMEERIFTACSIEEGFLVQDAIKLHTSVIRQLFASNWFIIAIFPS